MMNLNVMFFMNVSVKGKTNLFYKYKHNFFYIDKIKKDIELRTLLFLASGFKEADSTESKK